MLLAEFFLCALTSETTSYPRKWLFQKIIGNAEEGDSVTNMGLCSDDSDHRCLGKRQASQVNEKVGMRHGTEGWTEWPPDYLLRIHGHLQGARDRGKTEANSTWESKPASSKNQSHSDVRGKCALQRKVYRSSKDFPGGPVAGTLCSQGRGLRFSPWSESRSRLLQLRSGAAK